MVGESDHKLKGGRSNRHQDPNALKNDKLRRRNKKMRLYDEKQAQNGDGFNLTISEYEDIAQRLDESMK